MKNLFHFAAITLLLCAVCVFTGCQKQPSASFSASKTEINVGESISFSNTTKDGSSYKWDFGDGETSNSVSPSHTYSKAGNFIVTLNAYSKNGKKKSTVTKSITVKALGQAAFWMTEGQYIVYVTIGNTTKEITKNLSSANCGQDGVATFTLPAGTYSYSATDGGDNYWSGTITIYADQCSKMKLIPKAKTGNAVFWIMSDCPYKIRVTMNGTTETITHYFSSTPNCGDYGCANFSNLKVGTYSYYAEDGVVYWEGTITIKEGVCSKMRLMYTKGAPLSAELRRTPEPIAVQ